MRSCSILVVSGAVLSCMAAPVSFTVSMEQPAAHFVHVSLELNGLRTASQEFKLPVWTPGYYRIMDYSKNVIRFHAEDAGGRPLRWSKKTKNSWLVETAVSGPQTTSKTLTGATIKISYDVYAYTSFVAESYLDQNRAYLVPAGVFMHPSGHLRDAVHLTVRPPSGWTTIATGLESGPDGVLTAPDFDTFYDCPMLLGSQSRTSFQVNGIPHEIVLEDMPASLDQDKMILDLRKIVETASHIFGELPYHRYTFLLMGGAGAGGIEHATSQASMFNPSSLNTSDGYRTWLSFIAHEYFHLYNVKRIRPLALGPFNYDGENYTNMLWVSEGFTAYYQDQILLRAGLMTRTQYLDKLSVTIARYENSPGDKLQSATEASFDTWIKAMNRGELFDNTTISYYDKGAALGALLDLTIRHYTENRMSLDDVMRTLYQTYYKELKRGFTDEEFQAVCQKVAGNDLSEIFRYASTAGEIEYRKYFAYVGLEFEIGPVTGSESKSSLGATVRDQNGSILVTSVRLDSPAQEAALNAQDQILAIDGERVSTAHELLSRIANSKKPGDKVRLLTSHQGKVHEIEVTLEANQDREFRIHPSAAVNPIQTSWLGTR